MTMAVMVRRILPRPDNDDIGASYLLEDLREPDEEESLEGLTAIQRYKLIAPEENYSEAVKQLLKLLEDDGILINRKESAIFQGGEYSGKVETPSSDWLVGKIKKDGVRHEYFGLGYVLKLSSNSKEKVLSGLKKIEAGYFVEGLSDTEIEETIRIITYDYQ